MAEKKTGSYKFAMMSGALKNAGDFLIVKRSEELFKHIYPDSELTFYNRCESMEQYLEQINEMDAMVFCGGPAYLPQVYPHAFPLVSRLERIKIPMFALGLGWFGSSSSNKAVYNYRFTETSVELLKRIESDTKILGCRDWYSVSVLRNNDIWSGKMTGCPAWYNLEFVNQQHISSSNLRQVKKICISDSANPAFLKQMIELTAYARQLFPNAEIWNVFHRGMDADSFTEQQTSNMIHQAAAKCEELGARYVDISYSGDGFSVYDDCDLHIGFRVHAHIYNLSRRNVSILIEEDGRGAGVNKALGLENIAAYDYGVKTRTEGDYVINTIGKIENGYLLQLIDDYVNNLYQTDFLQIKNAFKMMQNYYQVMEQHVAGLSKFI